MGRQVVVKQVDVELYRWVGWVVGHGRRPPPLFIIPQGQTDLTGRQEVVPFCLILGDRRVFHCGHVVDLGISVVWRGSGQTDMYYCYWTIRHGSGDV